jgi:hypothetical protein
LSIAGGAPLGLKTVRVDSSTDGSTFVSLGFVSSGSGAFWPPVHPTVTTYYRFVFEGDGSCAPSTSGVLRLVPQANVGTPRAPSSVKRKKYFTVQGSLGPQHSGSRAVVLYLYRYEKGKWRQKSTLWAAAKTGGYKASVRITKSGKWRIKAYHRADAANAATWSGYRAVTVK